MSEVNAWLESYGATSPTTAEMRYLGRYLLSSDKFERIWKPIIVKLINVEGNGVSFNGDFESIRSDGGLLLTEEEMEHLRICMMETGDAEFVVIEDAGIADYAVDPSAPHMRFVFPTDVSWSELMSGNRVSMELFERPIRNYFTLGSSGLWIKYTANDWSVPTDLIAFHKSYAPLFRRAFA